MPLTKPIVFPITENMFYQSSDYIITNLAWADIPNWQVAVKANESYIFDLSFFLSDPSLAKFRVITPLCDMSGQMNFIVVTNRSSISAYYINNATSADFSTGAAGIEANMRLQFTLKADGIISFQSYSSNGAGNTLLGSGSYFSYRKVNLL